MEKLYFLVKEKDTVDIPTTRSFFSFGGWNVISIDKTFYTMFLGLDYKFIELSREDILGYKLFGECRAITKVANGDEEEDIPYNNNSEKIKVEVSETRLNLILRSMKQFAVLLLEEEFDKRLEKLNLSFSSLEKSTWKTQYEQASAGKGEFISALAKAKKTTIENLSGRILESKANYDKQCQDLYLKLSKLKEEFKSKNSVVDLNLLYSKYFGMTCSYDKEYCDAHPDIFDSQGSVIGQKPLGHYF